ncbi:MAG: hypothetical protein ACRD04_05250 [Terriglobales bacterium]
MRKDLSPTSRAEKMSAKRYAPLAVTHAAKKSGAERYASRAAKPRPVEILERELSDAVGGLMSARQIKRTVRLWGALPAKPTERQWRRQMAKLDRVTDRSFHLNQLLKSLNQVVSADEGLKDYYKAEHGAVFEIFRRLAAESAYAGASEQFRVGEFDPSVEGDYGTPWPEILDELANGGFKRLRACAVCDQLFLAERKDQHCCSNPCANVARQRRWRARAQQYKAARVRAEEKKHAEKTR